jgi:hypothetical protein
MGNFALQTGPCSSLILCISPWGIPSVFLLSSTLSWRLPSFYFTHRQHLSLLSLVYPLLHPARAPGEPRRRMAPRGAPDPGGGRPGSGRARPQAARLAGATRGRWRLSARPSGRRAQGRSAAARGWPGAGSVGSRDGRWHGSGGARGRHAGGAAAALQAGPKQMSCRWTERVCVGAVWAVPEQEQAARAGARW